jgi:hypothetical protein
MTILSPYILFGRGRKRSHPILIGCRTLDSAISLVQNPVMGLVGTIKHFKPLLCKINSFLVLTIAHACTPPFQGKPYRWRLNGYSARNMNCVTTTCIRKSTDILNIKRRDVWKKHGKLFWWRHTTDILNVKRFCFSFQCSIIILEMVHMQSLFCKTELSFLFKNLI